jgi:hypothetical protein
MGRYGSYTRQYGRISIPQYENEVFFVCRLVQWRVKRFANFLHLNAVRIGAFKIIGNFVSFPASFIQQKLNDLSWSNERQTHLNMST